MIRRKIVSFLVTLRLSGTACLELGISYIDHCASIQVGSNAFDSNSWTNREDQLGMLLTS